MAKSKLKFHKQTWRWGEGCPGARVFLGQRCPMLYVPPNTDLPLTPPGPRASMATAASSPCPPRHKRSVHYREENRVEITREEKGHCAFCQPAFWFWGPFSFRIWLIREVTDVVLAQYSSASGKQQPQGFKVVDIMRALESSSIIQVKIPT